MPDYTLYYWPIQFRGQFIRTVLAHVGADWHEAGFDDTLAQRSAAPAEQVVPHMGPPVLSDHQTGTHLSQMPAILAYLGTKHALLPEDPARAALSHKIIADANDVLYEMTRHNGAQMWSDDSWRAYRPRLARWMVMFELTGQQHGLTAQGGHMLGTATPGLADLVVATLWGRMVHLLPLRDLLEQTAPAIAGLCNRMEAIPALAQMNAHSDATFGKVWCSGQIEASLRAVLTDDPVHPARP